MVIAAEDARFIIAQRVLRLATADRLGRPHVVPVCFALHGDRVYIALDSKPKRVEPRALRRVRNLLENPRVALLADVYEEDWSRLAYAILFGRAALLEEAGERALAVALLRERYPQYQQMALEEAPIIAVEVERVASWHASQDAS